MPQRYVCDHAEHCWGRKLYHPTRTCPHWRGHYLDPHDSEGMSGRCPIHHERVCSYDERDPQVHFHVRCVPVQEADHD